MKKTVKKLLLAALAAAVLVSCFCLSAFAEEPRKTQITDILEYYEAEHTYKYVSFDTEEDGESFVTELPVTVRDGFAVITQGATQTVKPVTLEYRGASGNVGFNMSLKMGAADAGYAIVELGDADAACLRVVLDFAGTKKVSYAFLGVNGESDASTEVEGLTLSADVLYTLELYYEKTAKTVSLVVKDGTETYTVSGGISLPSLKAVSRVTLRLPKHKKNANSVISLDSLEVYNGSFARNAADRQQVTEAEILRLVGLYHADGTTEADKETLIRTIRKVLDYGFTTTNTEVNEALVGGPSMGGKEPFNTFSVTFYTNELVAAVEKIDTEADYTSRAAAVEEMTAVYNAIVVAGIGEPSEGTEYATALSAYRTEKVEVEALRTGSELMIANFRDVVAAKLNYTELSALLDAVDGAKYDETYPEITSSLKAYDQVAALKLSADTKAAQFLEGVSELSDTAASFAVRYRGYVNATNSYFDDVTFYTEGGGEKTYPISDALATYTEGKAYFDPIVEYNESFLATVIRAVSANDIASRMACIEDAEALLSDENGNELVEREYIRAGTDLESVDYSSSVEAAIAKINEMNSELRSTKQAVERFVALIATLKDAATMAEKKAIVTEAKDLRVSDDFLTLDGVVAANSAYSNAVTEIELWEGYSRRLLSAVASLEGATTLSDRAGYIATASASLAKLTDKSYTGVSEAEAKLVAAIKAYNRDVARANELFTRANDAALDTSYSAAPKTIVGVVAWLTKEQYKQVH